MKITWTTRFACLLCAGALVGCSDSGGDPVGVIPGDNMPPLVSIASPGNGSRFDEGEPVPFQGSAIDTEDGVLPGKDLVWSSDKDGEFATGTNPNVTTLNPGGHLVTLTATDSGGESGTSTITVIIDPLPSEPPVVAILRPEADDTFSQGIEVTFQGSATDPDGTDLAESAFVWSSDLDGQFGVGRLVAANTLSVGDHLVTLRVTDSDNLTGTATVSISITP